MHVSYHNMAWVPPACFLLSDEPPSFRNNRINLEVFLGIKKKQTLGDGERVRVEWEYHPVIKVSGEGRSQDGRWVLCSMP